MCNLDRPLRSQTNTIFIDEDDNKDDNKGDHKNNSDVDGSNPDWKVNVIMTCQATLE